MRHPFLRVDHLPVLVGVAGAGGNVWMLFRHALPGARVAVLEGEVFGVGAVSEDDRIFSLFHRAKNIRAQHLAVVHGDRHVPVDPHAVTDFPSLQQRGHTLLPKSFLLWAGGYRDAMAGGKGQKALRFRSSLRKRGPSAGNGSAESWIPACAGMSGDLSVSCASPLPVSPAPRRPTRCPARRSRSWPPACRPAWWR